MSKVEVKFEAEVILITIRKRYVAIERRTWTWIIFEDINVKDECAEI